MQKLPAAGSFYRANGVNNTGLAVGAAKYSGASVATTWPVGGPANFLESLPGFPHAEAVAVNDNGLVVGNIWTGKWNSRKVSHPVVWIDGICHDLVTEANLSNVTFGTAWNISDRGDVVGIAKFGNRQGGFLAIPR